MKTIDLTISRTIDASPEEVCNAWLDPKKFATWMMGAQIIMNPVVDGLYFINVDYKDRKWPHYGRYLAIQPGKRVKQTWMSESTHGLESILDVGFEPNGTKCNLTIRHTGLPDDNDGRQHEQGWNEIADLIVKQHAK